MRKELNLEAFIQFLNGLEYDKPKKVFTENLDDGYIDSYDFLRMNFKGNDIFLYESPYCNIGIIQDVPIAPWQDFAADVLELFEAEGEFKVFIEE